MNSPHQREQLPNLLSDALEPAERARVESHLEQCAQCQNELRALQGMQAALASLPMQPAPENLRANVLGALRENKQRSRVLPIVNAIGLARADKRQRSDARQNGKAPFLPLPFALPTRALAWGGAVALGALGLMLLGRPSLQNADMAPQSAKSEADFASGAAPTKGAPADAQALADNGVSAEGAMAGDSATADAVTTEKAKPAAPDASTTAKPNAQSQPIPAIVPGTPGADAGAQLPPLPPPPPQDSLDRSSVQPEDMAPIPSVSGPSFDLFPPLAPPPKTTARPPKTPTRPGAPPAVAPSTKSQSDQTNDTRNQNRAAQTNDTRSEIGAAQTNGTRNQNRAAQTKRARSAIGATEIVGANRSTGARSQIDAAA